MSTKYRDITFDVVRALCIVEVVCFWHLTNYIDNSFISERVFEVFGRVTTIVMGTFAFMSSYFLKRKKMENGKVARFMIPEIFVNSRPTHKAKAALTEVASPDTPGSVEMFSEMNRLILVLYALINRVCAKNMTESA